VGIKAWNNPNESATLKALIQDRLLVEIPLLKATAKQSADNPKAIKKSDIKSLVKVSLLSFAGKI